MDLTIREKFLLKGCIDSAIAEFSKTLSTTPKESARAEQRKILMELLALAKKVESVKVKIK